VSTLKIEKKHLANPQLIGKVMKNVARLTDLLISDPRLIARLYASAEAARQPSQVGEVIKLLPDATLVTLLSEVLWGKEYGGVWPGALFRSCRFDLLCRLTRLLPEVELDRASDFASGVFSYSSPGLEECIREVMGSRERALGAPREVCPDERIALISDVLGDLLGYQFNRGVVVMPRTKINGCLHPGHAQIAGELGIPTLPELGNGGCVVDAKGSWQFHTGREWIVPEDLLLTATEIVCVSLCAFQMPQECRDLCHQIGEDAQEAISQIRTIWAEVVAMTGEGGLEAFRWLPAVGVNLEPTICGHGGSWTGLKQIHVEPLPGSFPALALSIIIDTYSIHMQYQEVIEADGLLSGVDEPDEDTLPMQWGLNLLINRTVVEFMRGYVKSTCVKSKPCESKKRATRDGGDVAMCFPLLPKKVRRDGEPFRASDEAIERAMKYAGVELKPEMRRTFRTSPPITTQSGEYKPKPRTYVVEIG